MDAFRFFVVTPILLFALFYGLYRLALWAGADMDARGENGTPYSLLVFFLPVIGIPYWLMRRREAQQP